tara:strand:+ start:61 stop:1122 length:1062 start_codon:yes stop_codon:yes gene_type:complete
MATTFKTLLNSDIANTRTLLHEAIPITGTIVSGTYNDENIKTFSHGMFEAIYDYPFLSSSANHIIDITAGYSAASLLSAAANTQGQKKINIYNQHAQVLVGYDAQGNVREFDQDGNILAGETKMRECFFINFSRLLTKDEIKKESFRYTTYLTGANVTASHDRTAKFTIGDYGAATSYKANSPAGEYGLLYTRSVGGLGVGEIIGHVYYQAGIAVLTHSVFSGAFGDPERADNPGNSALTVDNAMTGTTITNIANSLRFAMDNVDFNNTTELNSTIYFCRANTQDYNYSANPTYLNASKIRVKDNNPKAQPVSYITTVGLYSADNELLAVAKLSEPLKKSPSNELTLRVRLDY